MRTDLLLPQSRLFKPIDEDEQIAIVCHGAIVNFCETLGDFGHERNWWRLPWESQASYIEGVKRRLKAPFATAEDHHNEWMKWKQQHGWTYGPTKDYETKKHPSLVPYKDLSYAEKQKDYIFMKVVEAFVTAKDVELD